MSTHRRELILENIRTTLAGVTELKNAQRYKHSGNSLAAVPCAIISIGRESKQPTPNPQATCTLPVFIDIWTRQDDSDDTPTDTVLNALSLVVEKALTADIYRGGYAEDTNILGFIPFETIEGQPQCGFTLEIEVQYQHKLTDPSLVT